MHLLPKVNRTQMFSAEMLHKLRGWHARRNCDHMHCVGGMLEEGISPCNVQATVRRRCDRKYFRGHPGCYITKNISTRPDKGREEVSAKICTSVPVCAAQLSSTLSHSAHTYILGYKKNRKEADYIFIHQRCRFLLLYNIFI